MWKKLSAAVLASVFVFSASSADAALMAYLKIKGRTSGDVKGSITQKGREGMIGVIAVSHEIVSPRDAQTGLATGKRQHKPLIITKEVDRSSPILYKMMTTNEGIMSLELRFWRPATQGTVGVGTETQFYTVKLTNASISSIKLTEQNVLHPDLMKYPETEEVSFTYEKIEWAWSDGNVTTSDSWNAPVN